MKPVPRWFVAVCWVLAMLFSLSAGLQINDPDPAQWIAMYLAAAIVIGTLSHRRWCAWVAIPLGVIAAAWAAYLGSQAFDVIGASDLVLKMSEKGGAVEVGREAVGLGICAVSLIAGGAFRATRW